MADTDQTEITPKRRHPLDPRSNVQKIGKYREELYEIQNVPLTVTTNEALLPGKAPMLTQRNVAKYLVPLTDELIECPPRPIIDELPDAVINKMVEKDKAFWVDKPGVNDYALHDALYRYDLVTKKHQPHHQQVFPRSYQYDLECVLYRRLHACDGLKDKGVDKRSLPNHCHDCSKKLQTSLTAVQLQWAKAPGSKRWKDYPDLSSSIPLEDLKLSMMEVGRPFRNEANKWYNKYYPTIKHDIYIRKFAQ